MKNCIQLSWTYGKPIIDDMEALWTVLVIYSVGGQLLGEIK